MADENEKSLQDIIAQAMENKNASKTEEAVTSEGVEDKETAEVPEDTDKKRFIDDIKLPSKSSGMDLSFSYDEEGHHHHHHHHSSGHHHHHRKKKKKKAMIVLYVILGLLLAFLITAGIIIHHYISKLNLVDPNARAEILDSIDIDDLVDGPDSPKDKIDSLEDRIKANFNKDGLMESDSVMNILLLGTDARTNNERGRSDSMILVSINKATKEIVMTSFLRDIYLTIPGIETTRLNHAYAYGGADLVIDTLQKNFKIKIDRYAQVDFTSFITVIDTVGGVDIELTADELPYVNAGGGSNYTTPGVYNLNGKEALAYSRIRYVGTDFGRSERQRTVLTKIIEKAADLSLGDLDELLDKLFPNITTNLTESELFSMILKSPAYFKYDVKQCRVPMDDTYEYLTIRSMSVLGIDFDKNKKYLYKNIFDVE